MCFVAEFGFLSYFIFHIQVFMQLEALKVFSFCDCYLKMFKNFTIYGNHKILHKKRMRFEKVNRGL